jgi:ferric-dicitrate binding protein FerR (iron transport regulator)
MPATLTPLAVDQIAALRAGDEAAFEHLVKTRFDALVDKARTHLGDHTSAAPRVALSVLLSAWTDRAAFDTPAAVDTYLDNAVPHRVAEELRKRASLHRFELHEGVQVTAPSAKADMTADQAWQQISERLHVSAEQLQAHREESRLLARKHAREHVDQVAGRRVPVGMIAIGVLLLVVIVFGMRYMNTGSAELALTRALEAPEARTLRAFPGQRGTISLLDESTAQLGAGSTMLVPKGFGTSLRGVSLDGAAHFVVAPGKSPEFQVRARGAAVVATGTSFSVRAYDDDAELFVNVREGSVRVYPVVGKAASRTLGAGESLAIANDGTMRTPEAPEVALAFSWVDGELILDNVTLERALAKLRRWHNVDAALADSSLLSRPLTATLTLESAGEALDALSRAANLEVTYEGTQMVLREVTAPPAAGNAPANRRP